MGELTRHPAALPPAPAVMAILSRFDRQHLEAFMEVAVELMDVIDGDPDAETGNDVEDDFVLTPQAIDRAISDPAIDFVDQDGGAWVEWHTMRGSQKRGANFTLGHEDDEEDDPPGQCDEDGINTDFALALGGGPGCKISDPDYGIDDERHDGGEDAPVPDYGIDQSKGPINGL
jgi:hypothetical protein